MRMRMTDDSVAAATSAFGGYEERKTQVRTTILISELVFSFPRIYKNRAGYGYSFFCIISVLTSDILSLLVPFVVPTCQRLVHNVPLDPSTTVTTTRILAWNVLVGATLIITTNVLSMTMTVMSNDESSDIVPPSLPQLNYVGCWMVDLFHCDSITRSIYYSCRYDLVSSCSNCYQSYEPSSINHPQGRGIGITGDCSPTTSLWAVWAVCCINWFGKYCYCFNKEKISMQQPLHRMSIMPSCNTDYY